MVRDGWGRKLIRGWDHWLEMPTAIGDLIGRTLLDARKGEVVVADSTTVDFYRVVSAALDARPDRRVIVTDRANFPTDRYVLEGLADARGLEIRWIDGDPVEGLTPADVAAQLDTDVALVTFSHVDYRSAAIADMPAITALAHDAGALSRVGPLPFGRGRSGGPHRERARTWPSAARTSTSTAAPGRPAFLYVRHELQGELRNPIQGWFGQRDQFAMGQGYDPEPGIRSWLTGTTPVLGLAAVEEGVRMAADAGLDRIRAKGIALTEYAIELHDAWLAPLGCELGSPRDAAHRGAHVSIRHPDARRLCRELIAQGVVPDFREPDSIRLGLAPLYTRFVDVHDGMARLRALLA